MTLVSFCFWLAAVVAVLSLVRIRMLEEEREQMRAWHRGELAAREKLQGELVQLVGLTDGAAKEAKALVAKLDAAEASLTSLQLRHDQLRQIHEDAENLVWQIHGRVTRALPHKDHIAHVDILTRLQCVLEQIRSAQAASVEVNP